MAALSTAQKELLYAIAIQIESISDILVNSVTRLNGSQSPEALAAKDSLTGESLTTLVRRLNDAVNEQ